MSAAEVAAVALAFWPAWLALAVAVVVARLESGRRLWPARRRYAPPPDVAAWRRVHHLRPEERP